MRSKTSVCDVTTDPRHRVWMVSRVQCYWQLSVAFRASRYGGELAALRAAREFARALDAVLARVVPPWMRNDPRGLFLAKSTPRRSRRHILRLPVGVRPRFRKVRGQRVLEAFQAFWRMHGVAHQRSYSVAVYGRAGARTLATAERKRAENEVNAELAAIDRKVEKLFKQAIRGHTGSVFRTQTRQHGRRRPVAWFR